AANNRARPVDDPKRLLSSTGASLKVAHAFGHPPVLGEMLALRVGDLSQEHSAFALTGHIPAGTRGGGQAPGRVWARPTLMNTRAGVRGSVVIDGSCGASASHTALAVAAPSPGLPHSPRPRRPSGLVVARTSW